MFNWFPLSMKYFEFYIFFKERAASKNLFSISLKSDPTKDDFKKACVLNTKQIYTDPAPLPTN